MVRILNVIGKRPVGGIGSFVYNYQSHFDTKDLQIDYLLFDDEPYGAFDEKVKMLGSKVYVLPSLKNYRLFKIWRQIDKFMRNIGKDYTAIHLHSVNIAFMCFPSAKKYGVKNLISHSHATVYSDKKINGIRNRVLCANLLNQANIFCACSKAAGRFLYGEENLDRVIVFNNAIECDKYKFNTEIRAEVRKQLNLDDKLVVGHVGRFCEQKNQTFLIDIFSECKKIDNNSVLLLVGDGPQKSIVEEKVKKMGLSDSVIFLGHRTDVERLLQAMDVFVLPSLFEGLPVIGIEAQTAGLPMVVADSITPEIKIIKTKFLSLKDSDKKWANEIMDIVGETDRENSWKIVQKSGYDINIESKRLQQFYLNFLQ